MQETEMQNDVEFELTVCCRDRTLNLPSVSLANIEPALARLPAPISC
jgi:hypothetical protein